MHGPSVMFMKASRTNGNSVQSLAISHTCVKLFLRDRPQYLAHEHMSCTSPVLFVDEPIDPSELLLLTCTFSLCATSNALV